MVMSEKAKKAKSEYEKNWRKKNPDKVRAIQNRYWEKRLSKMKEQDNVVSLPKAEKHSEHSHAYKWALDNLLADNYTTGRSVAEINQVRRYVEFVYQITCGRFFLDTDDEETMELGECFYWFEDATETSLPSMLNYKEMFDAILSKSNVFVKDFFLACMGDE